MCIKCNMQCGCTTFSFSIPTNLLSPPPPPPLSISIYPSNIKSWPNRLLHSICSTHTHKIILLYRWKYIVLLGLLLRKNMHRKHTVYSSTSFNKHIHAEYSIWYYIMDGYDAFQLFCTSHRKNIMHNIHTAANRIWTEWREKKRSR